MVDTKTLLKEQPLARHNLYETQIESRHNTVLQSFVAVLRESSTLYSHSRLRGARNKSEVVDGIILYEIKPPLSTSLFAPCGIGHRTFQSSSHHWQTCCFLALIRHIMLPFLLLKTTKKICDQVKWYYHQSCKQFFHVFP